MQTSQFKICTTCDTLTNLYSQLDCSIMQFMKNKWTNQSYNTSLHFDHDHLKDLLRLKRILGERLFNPQYPSSKIGTDDIISYTVRSLYKANECHPCPCIDFTDFITTTSSSSSSSSTNTSNTTFSSSTTLTSTTSTTLSGPTQPVVACGDQVTFSGGISFPTVQEITLGSSTGTVDFDFNAFTIPDKFIVRFDGVEVINTGYRGSSADQTALNNALIARGMPTETIQGVGLGSASFNKNTSTTSAFVYIYAPLAGTGWNFTMGCPQ